MWDGFSYTAVELCVFTKKKQKKEKKNMEKNGKIIVAISFIFGAF